MPICFAPARTKISVKVCATDAVHQHLCQFLQKAVAQDVAVRVVIVLEMININHDQRQRPVVAAGAPDFFSQLGVKLPAIIESGQAVARGQFRLLSQVFSKAGLHAQDATAHCHPGL